MPAGTAKSLGIHMTPYTRIEALVHELYPGTRVTPAINQMLLEIGRGDFRVIVHDIPLPPPIHGSKNSRWISLPEWAFKLLESARRSEWSDFSLKYDLGSSFSPFVTLYLENALRSKKDQVETFRRLLEQKKAKLRTKSRKQKSAVKSR